MNQSLEYLKVSWSHSYPDEPELIFYEVDLAHDRQCLRSIELFADSSIKSINNLYEQAIEITPIPAINEINQGIWGEELTATAISQEEFNSLFAQGQLSTQAKAHSQA